MLGLIYAWVSGRGIVAWQQRRAMLRKFRGHPDAEITVFAKEHDGAAILSVDCVGMSENKILAMYSLQKSLQCPLSV